MSWWVWKFWKLSSKWIKNSFVAAKTGRKLEKTLSGDSLEENGSKNHANNVHGTSSA